MYYLVDEKEMLQIAEGYLIYVALRSGGVDNWEHCSESIWNFITSESKVDGIDYESMKEVAQAWLDNMREVHPGDKIE